jgi:hypothetical protein
MPSSSLPVLAIVAAVACFAYLRRARKHTIQCARCERACDNKAVFPIYYAARDEFYSVCIDCVRRRQSPLTPPCTIENHVHCMSID